MLLHISDERVDAVSLNIEIVVKGKAEMKDRIPGAVKELGHLILIQRFVHFVDRFNMLEAEEAVLGMGLQ